MDWKETINKHWDRMARLKAWAGLIGMQSLEDHHIEQMRNIQAENQGNRSMWAAQPASQVDDEMRQTILGDHTIHQHYQTPQPSQIGKILLGIGLAATGAGAGYGGYLIADALKNQPATQPDTTINNSGLDEDSTIKLTLPEWTE